MHIHVRVRIHMHIYTTVHMVTTDAYILLCAYIVGQAESARDHEWGVRISRKSVPETTSARRKLLRGTRHIQVHTSLHFTLLRIAHFILIFFLIISHIIFYISYWCHMLCICYSNTQNNTDMMCYEDVSTATGTSSHRICWNVSMCYFTSAYGSKTVRDSSPTPTCTFLLFK